MKYIVPPVHTLYSLFCILLVGLTQISIAQPLNKKKEVTHADKLRGSITPERAWWNVTSYNIYVAPDYNTKSIKGFNEISFGINSDGKNRKMQIDLQQPMVIDSILFNKKKITSFNRTGNVYLIDFGNYNFITPRSLVKMSGPVTQHNIKIFFHGTPVEAKNPPWDGGWIWAKDSLGRPWMTVACQGLGASVWYPCKDHQSDEPDLGALIQVKVPDTLIAVSNGRLYSKNDQHDGTVLYTWQVKNPINNYNIVPYIGKYVNFTDTFIGEKARPDDPVGRGKLDCSYWVLDYNLEKAKKHFGRDVKRMLTCFEYWFGPYPFYEDGYKLVESSHLGMEHQSATAYGNKYRDGYLGRDLSKTGWGLKSDYIIVHESGHDWFGNNITVNDISDLWVHEGITTYSETLFVECNYGKDAANEFTQGSRSGIRNTSPLIGTYGINKEGSGDMYSKGSNLIHTIRQIIDDDSLFRQILRGMNKEFYHKTVDSKDIEKYITKRSGKDLSKVFDQYLRTTKIPELEYKISGDNLLSYRWANCVEGFKMPVRLARSGEWLKPTSAWQSKDITTELQKDFQVDKNFYINVKKVQ